VLCCTIIYPAPGALLCCLQFIIGLGVAIAFAAAVPKLGATKGYIRAGAQPFFVVQQE
jgi:hypothetical protein